MAPILPGDNSVDSVSPAPDAGTILGSNSGAPSQNGQPTPPMQNQPASPAQLSQDDQHSHLVGRVLKHVTNALEGRQTVYTPDAATGTVVATTQPRKPGAFFRDIIGGMMAGAAAASEPTRNPSGAAGLARGFMGAQTNQQAQEDRSRNQAQDKAAQGYVKKQRTEAEQLAAAAVADNNMSSLNVGHHIGHFTDDEIDAHNASANALEGVLTKNGGQMAQVDNNGAKGNGPALMQQFNNDQTLMQGPEGYHRIASISYDTDGLKHDGHKWANADGSPLSNDEWNKRATVNLIDLPNAVWGRQVQLPGSVIKDLAPNLNLVQGDPSKSYSTTIGSVFSIGLKNKKQMMDARNDLYRAPQTEQEALALQAEADQINSDPNAPADLKRRAAVKGPLAEKWLEGQAAQQKLLDDAKAGKAPADPKSPEEAGIARAAAQFAFDSNTDPAQKATLAQNLARANALYKAAVTTRDDQNKADSAVKEAARVAEDNRKEDASNRKTMGYVEDQNGRLNYVSKYDAEHSGQYSAQSFSEMKPSEVAKDRAIVKPLGDVQMNLNHYRNATNNYDAAIQQGRVSAGQTTSDKNNLTTIFSAPAITDAASAHAGAEGFGISVPTLSADLNAGLAKKVTAAYNNLSPEGKQLADNYVRARAAIPAWVKALTNSGRGSKEQLEIELQNLLPPYYNTADIHNRLDGFQENLDNQKNTLPQNLLGRQIPAPVTRGGVAGQAGQGQAPAVRQGYTRIKASDGSLHDIPSNNLKAARQRDPNLTVVGQ